MTKRNGRDGRSGRRNERGRRAKTRALEFQQLEGRAMLSIAVPLATVSDRCFPAAVASEPAAQVGSPMGTAVAAAGESGTSAASGAAGLVNSQPVPPVAGAAASSGAVASGPAVTVGTPSAAPAATASAPAAPVATETVKAATQTAAAAKAQTDAYVIFWDGGGAVGKGVPVRLYNSSGKLVATQTTDSNGRVHFDSLPQGLYKLTAQFNRDGKLYYGQVEAKDRFSGPINVQQAVTVPAVKPTGGKSYVHVTVKDSADRQTIPGARVRLVKDGKVFAEYVSNSKGRAVFWHLPKGKYGVEVYYGGKLSTPNPKTASLSGGNDGWTPIVRLTA